MRIVLFIVLALTAASPAFASACKRNGVNVPLDDPNAPNKRNCAVLDNVPYCN